MSQFEIRMCASIGKSQNEDVVLNLVDKHPIIFDVAITKSDKVPISHSPLHEGLELGQRTRLQVTVLQVDDAPVLLRRQRPLAVVVDVERIGRRLDDRAVD